jgi:hypothetical protein
MATLTIPIPNHNEDGICTQFYTVSYKFDGATEVLFSGVFYTSPVVLNNLGDDESYEVTITRNCCNGSVSDPTVIVVSTVVLVAPASFTAVQSGANVDLNWDDYTGATAYEWQRADDSGFTTNLTDIETVVVSNATDLAVPVGTYWYRVRAIKGGVASEWETDSVTVA